MTDAKKADQEAKERSTAAEAIYKAIEEATVAVTRDKEGNPKPLTSADPQA